MKYCRQSETNRGHKLPWQLGCCCFVLKLAKTLDATMAQQVVSGLYHEASMTQNREICFWLVVSEETVTEEVRIAGDGRIASSK